LRPSIERALGHLDSARLVIPDAREIDDVGQPIRGLAARLGVGTG
jgi:hypothetical protein